ncbi:uncharacterized protein LOC132697109 [Cylas formicarius]|uniref:uncharacterized protein LOC132697109 n=1 Tax=Cylas formicarius TaxID=197179 RepID=UPI002958D269|nr:uncharacterized protein LOC132697109 [Cylas formicarius]
MKANLALVIVTFASLSLAEEVLRVSARDSYLDAYKESHSELVKNKDADKKNDRTYNVDPQYPVYSGPSGPSGGEQFGPNQYGPPSPPYRPPVSQYGPPAGHYGPTPQYGPPPETQYGPPGPVYGGPQSVQVFYGMPHAMLSLWDKLKWKLDLFTIGKILLKLVIFKKIVSLIAILCLLLFIPALKKKGSSVLGDDGEGDERSILKSTVTVEDKLNNIANFVDEAIQKYSEKEEHMPGYCSSSYCQAEKILKRLDKKMYKKLMKLYSKEMVHSSD